MLVSTKKTLRSNVASHCTKLLATLDPSSPRSKYLAYLADFVVSGAPEFREETILEVFADAEWIPRCEIVARIRAAIGRAVDWEKRVSRSYTHDDFERVEDIEVFLSNDFINIKSGEREQENVEGFVESVTSDRSGVLCAEGLTGFLLARTTCAAGKLFPGMLSDALDFQVSTTGVKRKRAPVASTAASPLFPWPKFMSFEGTLVGAATIPRLPLRTLQLCSLEHAENEPLLRLLRTRAHSADSEPTLSSVLRR
jgi:hypothetical protein